jgi:hypothetical protein
MAITSDGYPVNRAQSGWLRGSETVVVHVPDDARPGSLSVRLWLYPSLQADFDHASAALAELPQDNLNTQLAQNYLIQHSVNGPQLAQDRLMQRNAAWDVRGGFAGGGGSPAAGGEIQPFASYWAYAPLSDLNGPVNGLQLAQRGATTRYSMNPTRSSSSYDYGRIAQQRGGAYGGRGANSYGASTSIGAPYRNNDLAFGVALQDRGFGFAGLAQAPPEVAASWALANQVVTQDSAQAVTDFKKAAEYARSQDEPAATAVAANGLALYGELDDAKSLLTSLADWQQADGRVERVADEGGKPNLSTAPTTAANTAVAALAWYRAPEFRAHADKAIDWLIRHRAGGGFGSADDTFLALRALEANAAAGGRAVTSGDVKLLRDTEVLAQKSYDVTNLGLVTFDDFSAQLSPGENRLTLANSSTDVIPYAVEVRYHAQQPANSTELPVTLLTTLDAEQVELGQQVNMRVKFANSAAAEQQYVVAEIGLPAGLTPKLEQLDALRNQSQIDHFETRARTIVPYFRQLAAGETRELSFELQAVAPGQFTSPPSSAFLLNEPKLRNWAAPTKVEVVRPGK